MDRRHDTQHNGLNYDTQHNSTECHYAECRVFYCYAECHYAGCIILKGEGKTTYTFSVSVNAFSVEFPLACYQQAGRVWYVSRALRRTYTLFYPAPILNVFMLSVVSPMDKLRLTRQNLGPVFNSRCGCAILCRAIYTHNKSSPN